MKKTPDGKDANVLSKTPDKLKDGLQHCAEDGCKGCPYEADCFMFDGFSSIANDAYAYIAQLEKQIPKWSKADEELPKKSGEYLVRCVHWYSDIDGYECYKVVHFEPMQLWINVGNLLKVTHWMPRPEVSKDEH